MVSRTSLWEESDTPPLRPPLPACPQGDLWVVTQIPQPTSRSAAEESTVPGLQPEPGGAVTPTQPGSDTGIYTRGGSCRTDGQNCLGSFHPSLAHVSAETPISLPWAPWGAPVPRSLPPGKGGCANEAHGVANGWWEAQVPFEGWEELAGGTNVWIHSCPLRNTLRSAFAGFLPVCKP